MADNAPVDLMIDRAAFDAWAATATARVFAPKTRDDTSGVQRMNASTRSTLAQHLAEIAIARARGDEAARFHRSRALLKVLRAAVRRTAAVRVLRRGPARLGADAGIVLFLLRNRMEKMKKPDGRMAQQLSPMEYSVTREKANRRALYRSLLGPQRGRHLSLRLLRHRCSRPTRSSTPAAAGRATSRRWIPPTCGRARHATG